jgi:hypothetical protein
VLSIGIVASDGVHLAPRQEGIEDWNERFA